MLVCYTNELFPTHIRTYSVGIIQFWGRLSAFFCSFIVFALYYKDTYYPFLSYFYICLVAFASILMIGKDTTTRQLDVKVPLQSRIPVRPV